MCMKKCIAGLALVLGMAGLARGQVNIAWAAAAQVAAGGPATQPVAVGRAQAGAGAATQPGAGAATEPAEQVAGDTPTTITIHETNADPKVVLAEFQKQAHADIALWPPQMWDGNRGQVPTVTLDLDNVPFWTAISAFCDQVNCRPENFGNNAGITLMQGRGQPLLGGKVKDCGMLTMIATGASHNRSISYENDQVNRDDHVEIMVLADPKMRILTYKPSPLMDVIDDENGVSLLSNTPPQTYDQDAQNFKFEFSVPLTYPEKYGQKIAHLKGSLSMTQVTKTQLLEFDDLAASVGKSKTAGDRTVEIKSFSVDANQNARLDMLVTRPAGAKQMSGNIFSELRSMKVIDANGESQSLNGGGGGSDRSINWQCQFQLKIGKTAKFSWPVVTETKEVEIPFEFEDLALPQE